jgi:hypothetical protein
MVHASDAQLSAMREGRTLERSVVEHVDGCLSCRRAAGPLGSAFALPPHHGLGRRLLVACTLALVFAMVAIAPVRSLAIGFVEIFEPRAIAFVPMTAADLAQMHAMPEFSDIGEASQITATRQAEAPDARSASLLAGYHLRLPALIGSETVARFRVFSPGIQQLTFSEAKAHAWAAAHTTSWAPMPAGMDGSTLRVAFAPIVSASYALDSSGAPSAHRAGLGALLRAFGGHQVPRRPVSRNRFSMRGDALVVAQMPIPKVGSTGVSAQTIESYLLSQPGVPPRLAAAFTALRDPSTTLPIPIPIDRDYATPVLVDGVWGLGIGDNTGLGALVVWQRGGFLYGVGGTRTAREILAIANSLR